MNGESAEALLINSDSKTLMIKHTHYKDILSTYSEHLCFNSLQLFTLHSCVTYCPHFHLSTIMWTFSRGFSDHLSAIFSQGFIFLLSVLTLDLEEDHCMLV